MLIFVLCVCALMALLLTDPAGVTRCALDSLELFVRGLLPVLLPFFAGALMLEKSGALRTAGRFADAPARVLLRCPGEGLAAVALSCLTGFPTGARIVGDLRRRGALTAGQARRACTCAATCSPAFIVATAGGALLGSTRTGWLLLAAHLGGALINGFIWSRGSAAAADAAIPAPRERAGGAPALYAIVSESIAQSGLAMLSIGCTVVFFGVVSGVAFGGSALASGLLELTNGCASAACLPEPLLRLRPAVMCAVISFGSISVMFQSLPFLGEAITPLRYLAAKLTHAIISFVIALPLTLLLPASVPASAPSVRPAGIAPLLTALAFLAAASIVTARAARRGDGLSG